MDGVGGEAAVRQVQHPHAGSPAHGMVWYGMVIWYGMVQHPHQRSPGHEHSAGIQMFNVFIAWQRTNFPGIFHHKKNHFSIHI